MRLFSSPTNFRVLFFQQRTSLDSQCRHFHLMRAATARPNTIPDSKEFVPLDYYRKPTRIVVNLWTEESRPIIKRLSLQQVLETHIKPGHLLVPYESPTTNELVPGTYTVRKINLVRCIPRHVEEFKKTRKSRPKELHFKSSATPSQLMDAMRNAWTLMKEGYRIEVQVHRSGPRSQFHFSKMINNCIHLRPDVLLKAMPRKSGIVIDPQTNHEKACWVMGPAFVNKEEKLEVPANQTYKFYKRREQQIEFDTAKYGQLTGVGSNEMSAVHASVESPVGNDMVLNEIAAVK